VARTASDTTLFNTANTKYTRALDTTGGYPATYAMTAGAEYFISLVQVGTTVGSILQSTTRQTTAANNATGGQVYTESSKTDLPAPSSPILSGNNNGLYAELS
jgi:hypothetical protein